MHGYVRGRTKIEVYKKFRAQLNRKEIEEFKASNAPRDVIEHRMSLRRLRRR
jgi:hypothetical protein